MVFLAAGICWAPEAIWALTSRNEAVTMRMFLFSVQEQFVRLAVPAFCLVAYHSELTSASSFYDLRVESLEFVTSMVGGELPVDARLTGIAVDGPGSRVAADRGAVGDAAV